MNEQLIPAERRRRIREHLEVHQVVRSSALIALLGASEATIRRDLHWLERQGVVERTHGGAILSQRMDAEPPYSSSALVHPEEKRKIGLAAAALLEEGDTLFLNSGTTATEVIRALRARPDLRQITVITNNVTAALEARDAPFEVILIGGSLRSPSNSVVGRFALETLQSVYASKAMIGVDGVSLKYGCTTPIDSEAEVARAMIRHTRGPVIVVADHSKWGVVSNFVVATLDEIHTLVTDDGLGLEARGGLQSRSVNVVLPPASGPDGRASSG
ncbi:MAG: DeoR/GlpR family DNA-binding transcription regulator [Chloroflexota bacterium]